MRTAAALLLVVAGCSTPPPPEARAPLTIYGSELRVETWTALAVERGHFHADLSDYPCPMALLHQASDLLAALGARDEARNGMAAMLRDLCGTQFGPAYGGPDRLVVGLCRFGEDPARPEEALIFDFPRLRPEETERLFDAKTFVAAWERPPKTVTARLERGWVRVRRLNPGDGLLPPRYDFEVFVVLAPVSGNGPSIQVVTRVQAPPQ